MAVTELSGPMELPDIGGDCDGEYELIAPGEWEWTHERGPEASAKQKQLVSRCTRPDGALHEQISRQIEVFVREFKAR